MAELGIARALVSAYKSGMDECLEALKGGAKWRGADRVKFATMHYTTVLNASESRIHRDDVMLLKKEIIAAYVDGSHIATEYWQTALLINARINA